MMRPMGAKLISALGVLFLSVVMAVGLMPGGVSVAQADSCWDHNGSLMRLTANGQNRTFIYETTPHGWQKAAGVRPGTLLFNGRNSGDYYSGTSRVFSRFCPAAPLEYYVEGPVTRPGNQLRITLRGTRDANNQCNATGQMVSDTLVFTYVRDC